MIRRRLAGTIGAAAAPLLLLAGTGTASANPNAPYIGYGYANNPNAVWCVQHQFNYYDRTATGDSYPEIREDSKWGPETYNAILWIQKGLLDPPWDGIVGPFTGQFLYQMGDRYYTGYGSANPSSAYCWKYLPTTG